MIMSKIEIIQDCILYEISAFWNTENFTRNYHGFFSMYYSSNIVDSSFTDFQRIRGVPFLKNHCASTGTPRSLTLFREVWKLHYPHVKITKHDCYFRCTTCISCSSIIETGTRAQRAEAERTRQYHWDRVTTERRNVNDALYKSLHEEENFFFCEIDGMNCAWRFTSHEWNTTERDRTTSTTSHMLFHVTTATPSRWCMEHYSR